MSLMLPVLAGSRGDPEKGRRTFERLTCIECHRGGENLIRPDKPLKGEGFARKYPTDESIVKVIRSGVYGSSMPGFGTDVISAKEMVDLISYIRSLTPSKKSDCKKSAPSSGAGSKKKAEKKSRDK